MDPYYTDKTVPKVLFSLKGHTDRVNSVMWLSERILVSVSTDKSMIIWGYTEGSNPREYQNWTFKKGHANIHKESINYLRTY